jgi:hypothetical protein
MYISYVCLYLIMSLCLLIFDYVCYEGGKAGSFSNNLWKVYQDCCMRVLMEFKMELQNPSKFGTSRCYICYEIASVCLYLVVFVIKLLIFSYICLCLF